MSEEPKSTLLHGEFTVAVVGTFQSADFPYRAARERFDDPDAPERDVAFAEALACYQEVKRLNPDRVVRLLDRPFEEFFL